MKHPTELHSLDTSCIVTTITLKCACICNDTVSKIRSIVFIPSLSIIILCKKRRPVIFFFFSTKIFIIHFCMCPYNDSSHGFFYIFIEMFQCKEEKSEIYFLNYNKYHHECKLLYRRLNVHL